MSNTTDKLPKDIVDKIMLQADIDKLLHDDVYIEDLHDVDPYSLTPVTSFLENRIVNDYMKSSGGANTKRISRRMFVSEVTILGFKNNKLNGLCLTDAPYIKVDMPDVDGNYYIKTDRLKQLLKEFTVSEYESYFEDGIELVALFCIERQLLLDNCERR